MNQMEIADALDTLGRLFPSANLQDEEIKLMGEALAQFAHEDAIDVIKLHRLSNDTARPKFKQIIGALYERRRNNPLAARKIEPYSQVETLRRQAMAMQPGKANEIKSMSKAEIAMRTGRGWWLACSSPVAGAGGQRATNWKSRGGAIVREVKTMLMIECELDDPKADEYAQVCLSDDETYKAYLSAVQPQPAIPEFA